MATTIFSLDNIKAQVILPQAFGIKIVDKRKRSITDPNFANAGFFTNLGDGSTFPVGHLVVDGRVISNAASSPTWINVSRKYLTTLVIDKDNRVGMMRLADISKEPNIKYAISGIPILRNGYSVISKIKDEGYYGNELYNTWHTFIGIRDGKLVLIGAECTKGQMPYLMEVFGLNDCIKLDGGGSFILHSGDLTVSTKENRRIHNIITW